MYMMNTLIPFHSVAAFFFYNDSATTEIYTLSLHDALPICRVDHEEQLHQVLLRRRHQRLDDVDVALAAVRLQLRSEEHTSELQSPVHLVCRLLLEKKKITNHLYCPHKGPIYTLPHVHHSPS